MTLKLLNQYPVVPLANDESQILILLLLHKEELVPQMKADLANEFMYNILVKRLEFFNVKVEDDVVCALLALTRMSTPGRAALYVHTLAYLSKDKEQYTVEDLCSDFPMGFPSDEALDNAWVAQKPQGVNLVDMRESYP